MAAVIGVFIFVTYMLITAGLWKVFKKAGYSGWTALIPGWNTCRAFRLAGLKWFLVVHILGFVVYAIAFLGFWYYAVLIVITFSAAVLEMGDAAWQMSQELVWLPKVCMALTAMAFCCRLAARGACAQKLVKRMNCPDKLWWGVWLLPMVFVPILGFNPKYTWKHKQVPIPNQPYFPD